MSVVPSNPGHSTWTWDAPVIAERREISAFHRIWLGFMTARSGLGLALLVLLGGLMLLGVSSVNYWQLALCGTYLIASLVVRLVARPVAPGRTFDPQWVSTIGIDLIAFSILHFVQAA